MPKHKHKIVRRNQVKRRLREIGRMEILPRLAGTGLALDLMVRARPEAYDASFEALREELVEVTEGLCSSG